MISRPDPIKARIALHYLAKATKKFHDRENSKKKLAAQLKQLKKISTNTLQKHLTELEKRINETVRIENKILKSQSQEDHFHEELKNKINVLEGKLGKYMDTKDAREKRIKELEEKMTDKPQHKQEKILEVQEAIHGLEKTYEEAKKAKIYSKTDMERIKTRINALKSKLKSLKN